MSALRLAELERIARAAKANQWDAGRWFEVSEFLDDGFAGQFAEFMSAVSPDVVLRLIAAARASDAPRDPSPHRHSEVLP